MRTERERCQLRAEVLAIEQRLPRHRSPAQKRNKKGLALHLSTNIDSVPLAKRPPRQSLTVGDIFVSAKEIVWRQLGACRGLEPSVFYPDDEDEALEAKAVCADCGVRVACLEYSLQVREKAGVWGGATERERRRMIRQRRRTA